MIKVSKFKATIDKHILLSNCRRTVKDIFLSGNLANGGKIYAESFILCKILFVSAGHTFLKRCKGAKVQRPIRIKNFKVYQTKATGQNKILQNLLFE